MNKIDFAALMQPEYTEVEVPELGGTILIKKMQAREHLEIEKLYIQQGQRNKDAKGEDVLSICPAEIAALKVRLCVFEDKNKPYFDEKTIWELDKDALFTLYNAVSEHTDKLSQQEVENTAKK